MASRAEFERLIQDLDRGLNDEELEEALLTLALRRGRVARNMLAHLAAEWPAGDAELLDAAASLAARHHALEDDATRLRSWLALLTWRSNIARQLGGGPLHVLEESERLVMDQARLQGEAIQTIWREPMLQPKDAAVALGAKKTNREKVRRFRARSSLLGLATGGSYLYPAFQFDVERREIFPEVRAVNELLDAAGDPWGVASWWISTHARLANRPVELIGTERADDLLTVAESVVEPVG